MSPAQDVPSLVTSSSELKAIAGRVHSGTVALDTEFLRERTYRPRLCLVQIATSEGVFLIDPLAGLDLRPLAGLLADDAVEVVVHAGRQDFEIFYELFAIGPRRVFDVQIAAAFAGYGGSLPYARLVQAVLGSSIAKGESYTDWCRRPLTEAQLAYAADDVRFLLPLASTLKARLSELARMGWAEEEMRLLENEEQYEGGSEESWRRIPGRGSLSPEQTAVLAELARWREETAARRDIPRAWVVKDVTLIELARRRPSTLEELKGIRGLNSREAERSAEAILEAIERGARAPSIASPAPPPKAAQARARMLSGLADGLVRARCEREGVAAELVATRAELDALVMDVARSAPVDEEAHRLLRGWRRQLAGDAVLDLLAGRIALKARDRPPYVEEVRL